MNIDEYMETLDIVYRAHADNLKDTAQAGTDLHAELERYVKDHMNNTLGEYDAKIRPFITWSQENVENSYGQKNLATHEPCGQVDNLMQVQT